MDTSEAYIKMCGKAEEIQKAKEEFDEGDFISRDNNAHVFCSEYDGWKRGGDIFLPRQDQLQEMVNKKYEFDWELAEVFGKSAYKLLPANPSMGQLWLAFVMKEKYEKIWNGNDWIL